MIHDLTTHTTPVAELRTYYRNPRQGRTGKIAESLRVNGQYRPLVVNRGTHTGRDNEVLAGNHTLAAARDEGWGEVACSFVDVDEDQAARIVTADNRTSDLGTYDDRLLAELLGDLPDLDGTGYDPGDLESLQSLLDDSAWNDPDEDKGGNDEPDEQAFWPEIKLTVSPDMFEAWHQLLSSYEGKDDATKLAAHLRATGQLT